MVKKKDGIIFEQKLGMLLYTDAGTRPNPGFGACGIHGYLYNTTPATKGVGLGPIVPTSTGYYDKNEEKSPKPPEDKTKKDQAKEETHTKMAVPRDAQEFDKLFSRNVPCPITVEKFIDVCAPLAGLVTNNESEATAVIKGMEIALQSKVQYLHIATDSRYALNGITKWACEWMKNGWRKSDGTEVSNVHTWIKAIRTYQKLIDSGVNVQFSWVRGHNGETGNERADLQASIGVQRAKRGDLAELVTESASDGYWNPADNKHPFINHRFCYFNTRSDGFRSGVYYQGNQGKEETLVGNPRGDAGYSIIYLKEPDKQIESVRQIQADMNNAADSLFFINLGNLFTPDNRWVTETYGRVAFADIDGYRNDLMLLDEASTQITREFKPPHIAMRAVDELEKLESRLVQWVQKHPDVTVTDVTDVFYEIQVVATKKKKDEDTPQVKYKLKDEFVVGIASIRTDVKHPYSKDENDLVQITLTMGIDLIDRNALKRLEAFKPRVYVLAWADGDNIFRYATAIDADGSCGIWAGVYSNMRVVK